MKTKMILAASAVLLLLAGCAGGTLDDGDSADSILEVENVNIPPAQASGSAGACLLSITDMTVNLRNKAKSVPGEPQPFNDIVVSTVQIRYRWDDASITTPAQLMDIGGTVPAAGTVAVKFPPIPLGLITGTMIGHSANLDMTFSGLTVAGEAVQADGGGVFSIGGACN